MEIFGQVWENSGKNPSYPQKFACFYTYAVEYRIYPYGSRGLYSFFLIMSLGLPVAYAENFRGGQSFVTIV